MTDYILHAEPGHYNLSPILFKNTARDFFKCYLDFKPQGKHFSPVPFFLCSRERIKAKINRNREGPRQIHRWRSSKLNESGISVSS